MNESIQVSIIMPVFNSGRFLDTAIRTLLNQSYENFELICIEDASKDDSLEILYNFAKQDKRVVIYINKKNQGAANSRNKGLELARGEYVYFVDADDVFERELLENMMIVVERQCPDMVFINYDIFKNDCLPEKDIRSKYYYYSEILCKMTKIQDYSREYILDIQNGPYSRLYRKRFLERNRLKFQDIKNSNDIYFGVMASFLPAKMAHTKEYINLLHVREHNCKFRISNNKDPMNNFLAYKYLKDEMQKRKIWDSYSTIVQEKFLLNTTEELLDSREKCGQSYFRFLKEKGLHEMLVWENLGYSEFSLNYYDVLKLYEKEKFENSQYYRIDFFLNLIKEHEKKISVLLHTLESAGIYFAIWSAGKRANIFADIYIKYVKHFKGFIDNDTSKRGNCIQGHNIYIPQEILGIVDVVIIINQDFFNEIYDQIAKIKKGIRMISLEFYLKYNLNIQQSIVNVN